MGFLFFKSKKEKEREERRERRHALRRAESTVEEVDERIKRMEKEADAEWERAKAAAADGRQAAAQRALTSYRAAQVMVTKLEQKKWVFKQVLGMVNKVTNINVDLVEDVFDEAGDLLAEAGDTDKFWSQMYGREVEGSTGALKDHIPSMEDLEKTLQEEVAGKIADTVTPESLEKEL